MPASRFSLMIASAGFSVMASSRSASRPLRSPSTMRWANRSNSGSLASSAARDSFDEAADTPSNSRISSCSGSYPSRRRSQTRSSAPLRCSSGFLALVQEHRVEHLAGGGIEAERDVGQPERGLHVGMAFLQLTNRLDGLD